MNKALMLLMALAMPLARAHAQANADVSRDTSKWYNRTHAVKEVTVKSKRQRYSRKNNPAVELMRKVIAARRRTDLDRHDYYRYDKYQKITFAANDVNPLQLDKGVLAKVPGLLSQLELCPYNNKLILPLTVNETISERLYRKRPREKKDVVRAERSAGLESFFQTGDILTAALKDFFTDVNIYDNQIRLLQHPFTSPIGDDAIRFYRFYIQDTLAVAGDSCIHLSFLPNNQQDFGFRGEIYIMADGSYQVKRCLLSLPKQSDVNFVESMAIVQEFTKGAEGEWLLTTDDMVVELELFDFMQQAVVIRHTRLNGHDFSPIDPWEFTDKAIAQAKAQAKRHGDDYWDQHRQVPLSTSERRMNDFLGRLQQGKAFHYVMMGLKLLVENYMETGTKRTPSKVDIGPVNTMVSNNFIDGLRLRFGAQTTANLNPHLFAKGYYARGWDSRKDYYLGELTYSFNAKEYLPHEQLRRNITISSTYDVAAPSDKFMSTDKDNVFTSLKWTTVDKMMFYNRQRIAFEWEWHSGLRTTISLTAEENDPCGNWGEGQQAPLQLPPVGGELSGGQAAQALTKASAQTSAWASAQTSAQSTSIMQSTSIIGNSRENSYRELASSAPGSSPTGGGWEGARGARGASSWSSPIRTTELRLLLRYAPGEKLVNTKQRQRHVNHDAPILTLSHAMGLDNVLGGQYKYSFTEATFFKRFWVKSWGKVGLNLRAGAQWNQVPFPLLIMPAANLSYVIQDNTFELINNMEFLNDRYASLELAWDMNGKLFNRLPLIKRLKWREFLAVRVLWGDLTDKNNPLLERNAGSSVLMQFPEGSYAMNPSEPYVEVAAGVHNVFRFFHVEYVRRLNYLHLPTATKHGVRFMFTLKF